MQKPKLNTISNDLQSKITIFNLIDDIALELNIVNKRYAQNSIIILSFSVTSATKLRPLLLI